MAVGGRREENRCIVKDEECVEFLHWCLPRLRFRWRGFRKVRNQVCKRIRRRIDELSFSDVSAYREYLEHHAPEWDILDSLCRVTISRFYRDRGVFDTLRSTLLPDLARKSIARGEAALHGWSAGCCSGEEPYTLQILWKLSVAPQLPVSLPLHILATEVDAALIERARQGRYPESAVKDLPEELVGQAFACTDEGYAIREPFRENVRFVQQDIRTQLPSRRFHLILCRNLVFTYFEKDVQRTLLEEFSKRLLPDGLLVIGVHESLPPGTEILVPYDPRLGIYRAST